MRYRSLKQISQGCCRRHRRQGRCLGERAIQERGEALGKGSVFQASDQEGGERAVQEHDKYQTAQQSAKVSRSFSKLRGCRWRGLRRHGRHPCRCSGSRRGRRPGTYDAASEASRNTAKASPARARRGRRPGWRERAVQEQRRGRLPSR